MSVKTWKDKLLAKLLTRYPALVKKWAESNEFIVNLDIPWSILTKELNTCQIALVTTAGVHLRSQSPFDMKDKEGDPSFREIPSRVDPKDLTITHNYYDHRDADQDINVAFPMERLGDLESDGFIGKIAPQHFSFMGHITGHHINTLIHHTGPEVARTLKEDGTDIVFLTPA